MLGLPRITEIRKQIPKRGIYTKFQMNTAAKEKIDADISKIMIVNEVSFGNLHINQGKKVNIFFVVLVSLKKKKFEEKSISIISKLISQNMVFVLEYNNEMKVAIYYSKLLQTEWLKKENFQLEIKGFDFDEVWKNIIMQIGGIKVERGSTLDEQIELNEKQLKLEKEIVTLEKLARREKQPKKKFEIFRQINEYKRKLEEL